MSEWQVQTLIGYGWDNVWSDHLDLPVTFSSKKLAEEELADHFASMKAAGMTYNPDNYRITEVD